MHDRSVKLPQQTPHDVRTPFLEFSNVSTEKEEIILEAFRLQQGPPYAFHDTKIIQPKPMQHAQQKPILVLGVNPFTGT